MNNGGGSPYGEKAYRKSLAVDRWALAGIKLRRMESSFYGAHFPTGEILLCSPHYKEAQPLYAPFLCISALKVFHPTNRPYILHGNSC